MGLKFMRKRWFIKIMALCLCGIFCFEIPFFEIYDRQLVQAQTEEYVFVDELESIDYGRYTGNQGDSDIKSITESKGELVNGKTYQHGLSFWIARWNFQKELSWVWRKWEIPKGMNYLEGELSYYITSNNHTNFDIQFEVYGDDNLLYSTAITQDTKETISISVDIKNCKTVTIKASDNVAVAKGTSLGFGHARFSKNADSVVDIDRDSIEYNNHLYKIYESNMEWNEAKEYCESMGGHLATITESNEQKIIEELLLGRICKYSGYWMGAYVFDRKWNWVTGETFDYTNWAKGEPSNQRDNMGMQIYSRESIGYNLLGEWDDTWSDTKIGFICEWENIDSTIVGILEEASHADKTLTISGKRYKVSDDFSIADAGNIIAGSGDKYVICTTQNGIIVKLVKVSDVLEPHIFITTEGDDITYQNWEFTPSSQKIKVHVSCEIKGAYPVDTFWDSGIKMHIDSFKLTIQDDGINFGEKGIFNKEELKEIEQKVNKDVLIDSSSTYDFTVNVKDGYEPAAVNKQKFKIKAVVTAASQTAECDQKINVINLDYQRQIAEQKKEAQAAKNNTLSNAQKELERLCNGFTITDPPFMQEFLDKQQMTAFRAFLYTWLAEVNNANTYSDDDKVNKKINEKLGIDENVLFKGRPTKATTYFEAETKNYGKRRFEITLEIMTFQSGGKAWGSFGKLTCKIVDKKGIPGNILISADIPVAYANIDNFCDYVKGAAESAVKKAFNESWGKKADQVAEMFVNKTIMDVIKKQWGSFSKGVYKLFTKPTEDYVKKVKAECPVDVYVYDMDANLCGSIVNNVVDEANSEIAMSVQDDAKIFYLTGNDYSIKLVGNDTGSMTYTVEELDESLQNLRTITFNNLSLEKGTTYKGFVMEPVYIDNALYSLEKDGGDMIFSDTDTYQDGLIKNLVEGISLSVSEQTVQQDATLQLIATVYPETAANKSIRWESDNERVAVVDDAGLVTAVSVGEAVITAKSRDGSNILAACKIGVTGKSNGGQDNNTTGGNSSGGTTGGGSSGGGTTGGNTSGSGSSSGGTTGGSSSSGGTAGGNTSGGGSSSGGTTGGNSSGGSSSSGGTTGGNTSGGNPSGNDTDNSNDNPSGDNNKPGDSMQVKLLYYIIEFNANGGTRLSRNTMTLLNDDNLGILPKVQRENCIFNGWYTQKSGGTKVSSSTVLNAGTTLFAQWAKVDKPSKVKAPSLKSKKAGQLAVSFKKIAGVKGYEIAYSTNKKFPSSFTQKVVSASAKKTLKKLKSGKKYYVRVRAYKVDSTGKKIYGDYSKAKSSKIK